MRNKIVATLSSAASLLKRSVIPEGIYIRLCRMYTLKSYVSNIRLVDAFGREEDSCFRIFRSPS